MIKKLSMKVVIDLKDNVERKLSEGIKNGKTNTTRNSEKSQYFDQLSEQLIILKMATAYGNLKRPTIFGFIPNLKEKPITRYIYERSEVKRKIDLLTSNLNSKLKSKATTAKEKEDVSKLKEEIRMLNVRMSDIDNKLEKLNLSVKIKVHLLNDLYAKPAS